MKYAEALIAWNLGGEVEVGCLLREDEPDWTFPYRRSGGAAYTEVRKATGAAAWAMLFTEFHTLVVRDKVDVMQAHAEFLKIDEYRARISPDIPGAEDDGSTHEPLAL